MELLVSVTDVRRLMGCPTSSTKLTQVVGGVGGVMRKRGLTLNPSGDSKPQPKP